MSRSLLAVAETACIYAVVGLVTLLLLTQTCARTRKRRELKNIARFGAQSSTQSSLSSSAAEQRNILFYMWCTCAVHTAEHRQLKFHAHALSPVRCHINAALKIISKPAHIYSEIRETHIFLGLRYFFNPQLRIDMTFNFYRVRYFSLYKMLVI